MMNTAQKAAHRDRQKIRSERYRSAGLCISCGRPRDTEGIVRCLPCRESSARSQRQQFERQQIAPVTQRLPFYPAIHQVIRTYPPILPGVLALSFPISTRPVVVQA